jgi:dolichyl-phosphate beta-glucosyltransferase
MLGACVDRRVIRHYTGRVFATWVAFLTGVGSYDSQCGLKVIRSLAFAAIEDNLRETRFVFDVELALLLLQRGFKIREVPINWREVPGSKVSLLKDSIRMFSGILRIRKRCGTAQVSSLMLKENGSIWDSSKQKTTSYTCDLG